MVERGGSMSEDLVAATCTRKLSIWLRIGTLQEEMNDWERALAAYEKALAANPANSDAISRIGMLLAKAERYPQAIDYLHDAVSANSGNATAWCSLGFSYIMAGDAEKAYMAYAEGLTKITDLCDPMLWFGVGLTYDRLGKLDNALRAFESALKLAPMFAKREEIHYITGLIYKERGNFTQAHACFSKISTSTPSPTVSAEVAYQIGTLHELAGDANSALEKYSSVLERSSDHVKCLQSLGWLLHSNGNPQEALTYLRRAVQKDPNDADSYYMLGRVLMSIDESRTAYENYQYAVQLDGQNAHYWCSIAALYYHMQQHRDAMDAYRRAVVIDGSIGEVWYDMGTLYEAYEQFPDALDSYRRAVQLQPSDPRFKERLHLLEDAMVNGLSPPPPTGRPASEVSEVSPTTLLCRRDYIQSDVVSSHGLLPAPPDEAKIRDFRNAHMTRRPPTTPDVKSYHQTLGSSRASREATHRRRDIPSAYTDIVAQAEELDSAPAREVLRTRLLHSGSQDSQVHADIASNHIHGSLVEGGKRNTVLAMSADAWNSQSPGLAECAKRPLSVDRPIAGGEDARESLNAMPLRTGSGLRVAPDSETLSKQKSRRAQDIERTAASPQNSSPVRGRIGESSPHRAPQSWQQRSHIASMEPKDQSEVRSALSGSSQRGIGSGIYTDNNSTEHVRPEKGRSHVKGTNPPHSRALIHGKGPERCESNFLRTAEDRSTPSSLLPRNASSRAAQQQRHFDQRRPPVSPPESSGDRGNRGIAYQTTDFVKPSSMPVTSAELSRISTSSSQDRRVSGSLPYASVRENGVRRVSAEGEGRKRVGPSSVEIAGTQNGSCGVSPSEVESSLGKRSVSLPSGSLVDFGQRLQRSSIVSKRDAVDEAMLPKLPPLSGAQRVSGGLRSNLISDRGEAKAQGKGGKQEVDESSIADCASDQGVVETHPSVENESRCDLAEVQRSKSCQLPQEQQSGSMQPDMPQDTQMKRTAFTTGGPLREQEHDSGLQFSNQLSTESPSTRGVQGAPLSNTVKPNLGASRLSASNEVTLGTDRHVEGASVSVQSGKEPHLRALNVVTQNEIPQGREKSTSNERNEITSFPPRAFVPDKKRNQEFHSTPYKPCGTFLGDDEAGENGGNKLGEGRPRNFLSSSGAKVGRNSHQTGIPSNGRNFFGTGRAASFSHSLSRAEGGVGMGLHSMKNAGNVRFNASATESDGLLFKTLPSKLRMRSSEIHGQEKSTSLGKRTASALVTGGTSQDMSNEQVPPVPKPAVIRPSIEDSFGSAHKSNGQGRYSASGNPAVREGRRSRDGRDIKRGKTNQREDDTFSSDKLSGRGL